MDAKEFRERVAKLLYDLEWIIALDDDGAERGCPQCSGRYPRWHTSECELASLLKYASGKPVKRPKSKR